MDPDSFIDNLVNGGQQLVDGTNTILDRVDANEYTITAVVLATVAVGASVYAGVNVYHRIRDSAEKYVGGIIGHMIGE